MPIDPNIIMGIKPVQIANPLEQYMQVQQIQQAQNQSRLADLMYGEKEREVSEGAHLNDIYKGAVAADGTLDRTKLYSGVASAGLGSRIPGLQKNFAEADAKQADIGKTKAETHAKEVEAAHKAFDIAGQAFGFVRANPTLDNALAAIDYLGSQPGLYKPELLESWRQQVRSDPSKIQALADQAFRASLAAKDQLPKIDTRNLGGTTDTISVDPVTGAVKVLNSAQNTQSPDNAATVAATRRGQDMTDRRAREQIAAGKVPSGYRQGPDGTLVPIPGGPADSANKPMTEDQAKATGWLVQAENAWKNMQGVGLGKDGKPTDAAKPGRIETALSAALPFGAGDAAANSWRNADRQRFLQASSSLSEALLRAATGAGVNKEEAMQKVRELTPVWGDRDENIKQKMDSIPLYIESLKVRSGPGAAKAAGVLAAGSKPQNNGLPAGWSVEAH
jgi:hypothetical protein